MKVKRLLALLTAVMLLFAAGCGGGQTPSNDSSADTSEPTDSYQGITVKCVSYKTFYTDDTMFLFEHAAKKNGMKIDWQTVSQNSYVDTIAASIANDTQADFCYAYGDFPRILSVLEPLEVTGLNLNEDFADRSIIRASTVGGKPYLVNGAGNTFNYIDVCVYNKALFEENRITTPKEFYDKGEWTLDNFKWCAEQISALGKDYVGAGLLAESSLSLAGTSFFTLQSDRITVNTDQRLYGVMNFLAELKDEGFIKLDRSGFEGGKQGMALTDSFGLQRFGYFVVSDLESIGVTFMPKADKNSEHTVTALLGGWGIVKGAKNPKAAGVFLKNYLDFDSKYVEDNNRRIFHNQEISDFYLDICENYADKIVYYIGCADIDQSLTKSTDLAHAWSAYEGDDVTAYLDSKRGLMQEMCDTVNKYLE